MASNDLNSQVLQEMLDRDYQKQQHGFASIYDEG